MTLSKDIGGVCIARMLDSRVKVMDGQLFTWKHEAIKLEGDLAQALERESRLQFALTEAGLELAEPWHNNEGAESYVRDIDSLQGREDGS